MPFPSTTFTGVTFESPDDLAVVFFFSFSRFPISLPISILFVFPSHNSTIGFAGPVEAGVELEVLELPPPPPPAILAWRAAIFAANPPPPPVLIGGLAPPVEVGGFDPLVVGFDTPPGFGPVLVAGFGGTPVAAGKAEPLFCMFGAAAAGFVAGGLFIAGGNAEALPGGLVTAGFEAVDVFGFGAPAPPTFFI